ncbi:cation diffusion facilitator family transporter [Fulvivirga lutea]|uniref:Cation transporter n=1 Tax=Fulvivirga lutea TaxID=2810512 RepID=A0A975A082_9BACT|nr:cation diffusion facilitator family transporter [Fulvivirga lutea]QSE96925.1 cation transporter [Fulvivirga lutea]
MKEPEIPTHHQEAIIASKNSLMSNMVLAVIKGVAGFFGNSYALIADAIESTTDVFASLLVLLGIKYANKPADSNHPYGHGKIEPLITFLVVGFLITAALSIAYHSVLHIITPHKTPKPWTLIVLGLIIIWKELSFRYMMRKSVDTSSSALKAEAWHHRSDAITSVAAFIGISVAVIFGEGYETADDWAALFASGFIIYNSYLIFRPALGEIMDEHFYDDMIEEIREVSLKVEGVMDTEKCFIRKSGMKYHVDLHAIVDGTISVKAGHDIAHQLKDRLEKELPVIDSVLVHIEPFLENKKIT